MSNSDKVFDSFWKKLLEGTPTTARAALATIVITWLTIFFQSVKVAGQNPVDILMDE